MFKVGDIVVNGYGFVEQDDPSIVERIPMDIKYLEMAIDGIQSMCYWHRTKDGDIYWNDVIVRLLRIKKEGR